MDTPHVHILRIANILDECIIRALVPHTTSQSLTPYKELFNNPPSFSVENVIHTITLNYLQEAFQYIIDNVPGEEGSPKSTLEYSAHSPLSPLIEHTSLLLKTTIDACIQEDTRIAQASSTIFQTIKNDTADTDNSTHLFLYRIASIIQQINSSIIDHSNTQ